MGLGFVLALGLRVKVRVRGFVKGLMAFAARFLGVQLGPSVVLAYSFSICGMLRGRNAQSSEFGLNQVLTLGAPSQYEVKLLPRFLVGAYRLS